MGQRRRSVENTASPNQAFRYNRQAAPRAPTNWILLCAHRRKTMSLHYVKWMNARLQGLLVFEVSRLSFKSEIILSLKGNGLDHLPDCANRALFSPKPLFGL